MRAIGSLTVRERLSRSVTFVHASEFRAESASRQYCTLMQIALVDPGDPLALAAGESGIRDGAPFAFAGLRGALDRAGRLGADRGLFGSKSGNPVETCTILTTAANDDRRCV